MKLGEITLDVCAAGCGGIWFDAFELQKVDEPHESTGAKLLEIERNKNVKIDYTLKRSCPKCSAVTMMKHFFSVKRSVEVDECPKCGGFWLDYGELGRIRNLFESEGDRREAAKKYFDDIFGDELAQMHRESKEKTEQAKRIARMFRFICPSNYIPGKQEWGAY
jgi:Zn-finger nucleic acid-binding protein